MTDAKNPSPGTGTPGNVKPVEKLWKTVLNVIDLASVFNAKET